MTSRRGGRIAPTKAERESAAGIELLALCQSVTEDGHLSDDEVHAFKTWLAENEESDLAAIPILTQIVNQILDDGVVSDTERKLLHQTLERILPPGVREVAILKRREQERSVREDIREARAREKDEQKRLAELNRPTERFDFMVAGAFAGNRPRLIAKHVREEDTVYLTRDPDNKFSPNAVEVRTANNAHIGYVPEEDAKVMAPRLDRGEKHYAYVKKILSGGRVPIPVIAADTFSPEATCERAVAEFKPPSAALDPAVGLTDRSLGSDKRGFGILWVAVAVVLLLLALLALSGAV